MTGSRKAREKIVIDVEEEEPEIVFARPKRVQRRPARFLDDVIIVD
jgi:hypothetical protein